MSLVFEESKSFTNTLPRVRRRRHSIAHFPLGTNQCAANRLRALSLLLRLLFNERAAERTGRRRGERRLHVLRLARSPCLRADLHA